MTRQVGNEIDEFVTRRCATTCSGCRSISPPSTWRAAATPACRRSTQRARDFYEASTGRRRTQALCELGRFRGHLKHEASIINFIAAYGTHSLITSATTLDGKRDAAMTIIFGQSRSADWRSRPTASTSSTPPAPTPAAALGGLENIDLWIGGLAEKIMPFGGMLGSTFNFVFEVQLEKLQDGDRFYYLQRLDGLHLLAEMENNTFAKLIMPQHRCRPPAVRRVLDARPHPRGRSDQAVQPGTRRCGRRRSRPADTASSTPLVHPRQSGDAGGRDRTTCATPATTTWCSAAPIGNDILIGSEGDDTLYGDGGNDRMEGGDGNDQYIGGDGDDIITDLGGDDIIRSGDGNDVINAGHGVDLIVADEGQDFIVLGDDMLDEAFGGVGNDFILGSKTTEQTLGGEGDDWIEVGAWTGAVGDNFDDQFAARRGQGTRRVPR